MEQIFQEIDEERERQSKFIKIQPGETKTVKINPVSAKVVDREFNGKKSKRVNYEVTTLDKPLDIKILAMSLENAVNINALLRKGFKEIEIRRIGAGLDTKYTFTPA